MPLEGGLQAGAPDPVQELWPKAQQPALGLSPERGGADALNPEQGRLPDDLPRPHLAQWQLLAPLHPTWRFTLVDPSEAMLDVARAHALREGFADRCSFHPGLLATLPPEPHAAATSLLVSHFLTDEGARRSYFREIAQRLEVGGVLVNADLCADREAETFPGLMELWLRMLDHSGVAASRGAFPAAFGRDVAVHGPDQVAAFIAEAGFTSPIPCFQAVLMRGWVAHRR